MARTARTESEKVLFDCEAAIKSHTDDLDRAFKIWEAYYAVGGKQWPEEMRQELRNQQRHPWQFDVLGPKVEILAGSLAAEIPDIDWMPIENASGQAIEAVREKYYSEKELFNYDDVLLYTIRDGCVHSGWCQLRESRRYSDTGNISLERCRPGYIIADPYWVTDNDRDLECIYKIAYLLPEQIANLYPKQTDAIKRAIQERKRKGLYQQDDFKTQSRDEQQRKYMSEVGDQFRVIEKFYTKTINAERLVGMRHDEITGQNAFVPFPVTKDKAMLQQFAEINNISWDDVMTSEYREKKQYVKTVTDLDDTVFLEDGETREQVNGLSFFHFTCMRYNGHDKGIAESIYDTQRVINEKESYILEYIAKAGGGSEMWNEELFKNEEQKKRFVKNKNKFGHVEFGDLDAVRTAKIESTPQQIPSAVFQEIQRMYEAILPIVSRVGEAMSGQTGSEDTGVLYERKYQVNRIANVILDKYVKQLINNIGEAYYYQFQVTHGDVEQEVKRRAGGSITINKKEIVGNQKMVINDVSSLPRTKIVVTESKSNPIYQLRKKMEVETILRSIPPTDTLRMQTALNMYFENMALNDQTKSQVEVVNALELKKAMLQYAVEIATLETQIKGTALQSKQITMQMAQIENAMMPQQQMQSEPSVEPEVNQPQPSQQQQGEAPRPPGDLEGRAMEDLPREAAMV